MTVGMRVFCFGQIVKLCFFASALVRIALLLLTLQVSNNFNILVDSFILLLAHFFLIGEFKFQFVVIIYKFLVQLLCFF